MPDYAPLTLPCWTHCGETFPGMVEMQAHHLAKHERSLHGQPVAIWLARDVTPAEPALCCTCGCAYVAHAAISAEQPLQPCGACGCRAFVLALVQTPVGQEAESALEESALDVLPNTLTVLAIFRGQCAAAHLPYREIDARLLLEALGVPPDAPAAGWRSAIQEAVAKWRDR